NPLRVAMLTDLHGGAMVYRDQISNVVDLTNSIKNLDAIFIVGDAIDAPMNLIQERMEPLKYLKSKHGVFFVSGNHEFYYGNYDEWKQLFESYGINVMENEVEHLDDTICLVGLHDISSYKSVEHLDDTICLVGLHDISSYKSGIKNLSMDESSISKCQKDESVVVLAHNPASTKRIMEFANISGKHVDLILSGHTHSGQYYILVPYVYWLLPYLYGLYPINHGITKLFVSAGTLYQASPMKMYGKSEIWLLTLTGINGT
uniref:Calcineurin-like phosphoesterase domain-containing protein n=1 Tax=Panagrolaimus sp. JU765 TaxID=591449 RepID=A0AC34R1Q8_9BILA